MKKARTDRFVCAFAVAVSLLFSACADDSSDASLLARPSSLGEDRDGNENSEGVVVDGVWTFCGNAQNANDIYNPSMWNCTGADIKRVYFQSTNEDLRDWVEESRSWSLDATWYLTAFVDSPEAYPLTADVQASEVRLEDGGAGRTYAYVDANRFYTNVQDSDGRTQAVSLGSYQTSQVYHATLDVWSIYVPYPQGYPKPYHRKFGCVELPAYDPSWYDEIGVDRSYYHCKK